MFRITVEDLATGEKTEFIYEHAEVTHSTGFRRLDPDGSGPMSPQIVETGAATAIIKCWTGEALGMATFDDFINYTDDTGGTPDDPGV